MPQACTVKKKRQRSGQQLTNQKKDEHDGEPNLTQTHALVVIIML